LSEDTGQGGGGGGKEVPKKRPLLRFDGHAKSGTLWKNQNVSFLLEGESRAWGRLRRESSRERNKRIDCWGNASDFGILLI